MKPAIAFLLIIAIGSFARAEDLTTAMPLTEFVTLANDTMALEFAPNGELLKIANRRTGVVCSIPAMRSQLVGVTVLSRGGLQVVPVARVGEPKVTANELRQQYVFGNGQVEAEVRVRLGGDELSRWTIRVTNYGDDPVVHVDFPKLAGLRMGERGEDDWVFLSKVNGNLYRDPARSKKLAAENAAYSRSHVYKFVSLWDGSGGLYVVDLDPTFRDVGIYVSPCDETSLKVDFRKWVCVKKGGAWQSAEFVLAAHAGDWHWAADHYREWLEQQKIPDLTPRWLREEFDGWDSRAGMFYPADGFYGLVRTFETSSPLGLDTVMSNRQMFDANVGWCGLAPAANPTWGTEQEMAQANLAVQERGGHTFHYINWHLWHRAYSTGARIGRNPRALWPRDAPFAPLDWYDRNVVRHPDGTVDKETPFAVYEEHPLCNAATDVMKFHADWARYYTTKYRATGIYWDTLCDTYQPCYALDHGHADLGQWQIGSRRALEESIRVCRKLDPHYASAAEGLNSAYLHGATDLPIANGIFVSYDVARYTTPHSILVGGAWDTFSPPYEQNLEDMNYQFLTAVRFMGLTWDEKAEKTLRLRRAVKQLLYPARYRDTVGLTIERPSGTEPKPRDTVFATGEFTGVGAVFPPANGILATHLRLDRAGSQLSLVNLLNTTGQTGATVTLSKQECPSLATAWLVDRTGSFQPLSVIDSGKGWKFSVPTDMQSTALLSERCEPLVEVEAPAYAARGETVSVTIRVRNLNPESVSGTVKIVGPRGFKARAVRVRSLAAGETQAVTLRLRTPRIKQPQRFDLDAVVETPYGQARRLFWMYVGQPVRLTVRESTTASRGVDVLLENQSRRPVPGACAVPASDFVETAKVDFDLAAHAPRVLVIPLAVKKPFDLPTPVQLKVRYGNVTREFTQSLTPTVINGDFEVDRVGDGQPDGWSFYGSIGIHNSLRYDQVALDDQVRHSGRYSLRLPPAPSGGSNRGIAMRTHVLAGRSYRVRAAIRREVAGPVYVSLDWGTQMIGRDGTAGKWEMITTVVSPKPMRIPGPGAQTDCLGSLAISIVNESPGKAWFDGITVEPVE